MIKSNCIKNLNDFDVKQLFKYNYNFLQGENGKKHILFKSSNKTKLINQQIKSS